MGPDYGEIGLYRPFGAQGTESAFGKPRVQFNSSVIPAQAGIQYGRSAQYAPFLDSRLRGNDGADDFPNTL
jgi:hypothetical protein